MEGLLELVTILQLKKKKMKIMKLLISTVKKFWFELYIIFLYSNATSRRWWTFQVYQNFNLFLLFRYLLKYGNIKRIEKNNSVIFAELPQIPGTLVFYRKKNDKENNIERWIWNFDFKSNLIRLFLDGKELTHIPLLEGEESLKLLSLKNNLIDRVQNLVSLPNLIYLDLTNNKISELENFQGMANLRVLIVGKNKLTRIKNLECLNKLEILDLHSNLITNTEGLKPLPDLK